MVRCDPTEIDLTRKNNQQHNSSINRTDADFDDENTNYPTIKHRCRLSHIFRERTACLYGWLMRLVALNSKLCDC